MSSTDDPAPLYHRTQALYQRGDRILPGNWGRLILGTGPQHARFYAEYLLERIRVVEFPATPSRMTAAFAFEDRNYALAWDRGVKEYVYAVRLLDVAAPKHRGNMDWIDAMNEYRSFEGVEACARHYWLSDERNPPAWEMLAAAGFVVEERLTPIPEDANVL